MRDLVQVTLTAHWLRHNTLLQLEQVAELLEISPTVSNDKISLEMEDYLHGLAGIPSGMFDFISCKRRILIL